MSTRQFLREFRQDERLATGAFFEAGGLCVRPGDHVGVVLFGSGGPRSRGEIEDYLYRRWMDPVLYAGAPRAGRHLLASVAAKLGAGYFWRDFEEVGGHCPSDRLIREQAAMLEGHLASHFASSSGATFSVHVSTRYGYPSIDHTYHRMHECGVTKVVLLPAHPQYSIATTGASLSYWSSLHTGAVRHQIPISSVVEYSVHPLYLQALSERIDQALQRFPRRTRQNVELVFCAEHAQVHGSMSNRDSFCDLAQTTVERLMDLRAERRRSDLICFRSGIRTGRSDERDMRAVLSGLSRRDVDSVLIVPLGISTDHVWTAYTLDIRLRAVAAEMGIGRYEVTAGLNCHPLFISALADVVATQLGATAIDADVPGAPDRTSSRRRDGDRKTECPTCRGPVRARDWGSSFHRGAALR